MSKRQLLIIIGIWIMLFLFLGFPQSWDKIIALITGFVIIVVAYKIKPGIVSSKYDIPFIEHKSGRSDTNLTKNSNTNTNIPDTTNTPLNITSDDHIEE